jgi:predicted DNA binding protein
MFKQIATYTRFRARVPTREALSAHRDECVEQGLDFHLNRLYREEQDQQTGDADKFGLTPIQRETLEKALSDGYFDVPQQTNQETLATEFGVSNQALSARLRRGLNTLLMHTIGSNRRT